MVVASGQEKGRNHLGNLLLKRERRWDLPGKMEQIYVFFLVRTAQERTIMHFRIGLAYLNYRETRANNLKINPLRFACRHVYIIHKHAN